jgi:flagellar protein FliO/FliZ
MTLRHYLFSGMLRIVAVVATLLLSIEAVHAADAPLFAAPSAGHATSTTGDGSLAQVALALGIVLVVVFVVAWALRHLRQLNLSGNTQQLQIIAQVALGAKERAVLIRVNEMQVLVGVAPGQVTALHRFPAPVTNAVAATGVQAEVAVPTFQSLLKKSLGLWRSP